MSLYWGDIHNHCNITYGYGSLENALSAAARQLDFCSVTPHAMWPDHPEINDQNRQTINYHLSAFERIKETWDSVKAVVEAANQDNQFVTFHSYEMHSSHNGDYHIVSPDPSLPLIEKPTVKEIIQTLPCRAIAIPHHIAYPPGYRGINWDQFDETISPFVEVYSKHGCGFSDDAPFPFYHTMGPRDGRNTAVSGLKQGKRFSFAASTDHHAGFPGSYGDGRMAVLAPEKTREAIWTAMTAGHVYAVTGDPIACSFYVNDQPFGSRISAGKQAEISYHVQGWDMIDKIVIKKNLHPVEIINGDWLTVTPEDNEYILRIELGWGRDNNLYNWDIHVDLTEGIILECKPCLRGRNILAPLDGNQISDNINAVVSELNQMTEQSVHFTCQSEMNPTTVHSQTQSLLLRVRANPDATITIDLNGRTVRESIRTLLKRSQGDVVSDPAYSAYLIHQAVPKSLFECSGKRIDANPQPGDFYHLEVYQKNGCCAFVSPVYLT